jgi:alanine dehydrogenase
VRRPPALHCRVHARGLQGLTIGVPREQESGEGRVALIPANVTKLIKAGAAITIQSGAGSIAGYTDAQYKAAGANIDTSASGDSVWSSQLVAKILPPTPEEVYIVYRFIIMIPCKFYYEHVRLLGWEIKQLWVFFKLE